MNSIISFYIPAHLWPDELPTDPDQNWAGFGLGLYTWTIQTYLRLRAAGVSCVLTKELPEEGIVLCYSNAIKQIKEGSTDKRLLVCMKAEAPLSAIAPLHIVQNPLEANTIANRFFIPHWPQPQLMERDRNRGDRFENLAFFGHANNLAAELTTAEWQQDLAKCGLTMQTIANTNSWNKYHTLDNRWNNYITVDAVIAVRSFNPWQQRLTTGFSNKPATKLYNAWLSGSIPILGKESAYRETGTPGKDYVEVTSYAELLDAIDKLKTDIGWRRSLIAQGQLRAKTVTHENILKRWQLFLNEVAIPAYEIWRSHSPRKRQQILFSLRLASYQDCTQRKQRKLLLNALSP
ncbi:MAG: hypothetical protein AAGC93_18120 [Cyanobacteria bacterium P01_F01_bin.53]